jgi:hypothetical protein
MVVTKYRSFRNFKILYKQDSESRWLQKYRNYKTIKILYKQTLNQGGCNNYMWHQPLFRVQLFKNLMTWIYCNGSMWGQQFIYDLPYKTTCILLMCPDIIILLPPYNHVLLLPYLDDFPNQAFYLQDFFSLGKLCPLFLNWMFSKWMFLAARVWLFFFPMTKITILVSILPRLRHIFTW